MYTLDATGAYWRCILIVRIFRIMGLDSNIGSAGFDSCKQQPNSIYRCTNLLYIFQYIYIYTHKNDVLKSFSHHTSTSCRKITRFFFVTRLF